MAEKKRNAIKEAKTFRGKCSAYWYYYKWHTVIAVVILALVTGGMVDFFMTKRAPNPDFTVFVMTGESLSSETQATLEEKIKRTFPEKDGKNPSVEFFYHVIPSDSNEEGGNDDYNTTLMNAGQKNAFFKEAKKSNAIFIYDDAYLAEFGSSDSWVSLSEQYPQAAGVDGIQLDLSQSTLFEGADISETLHLRMKTLSGMQFWGIGSSTKEKYAWQQEALDHIMKGELVRTSQQVEQADKAYRDAVKEAEE